MGRQTVIVGAGVIGLLEAAHEVASGRTVLVVEKSHQIGGAWATTELSGWKGVENGVHYLSPDVRAHKFLSQVLGIDLDQTRPKYLVTCDNAGRSRVLNFRSAKSRLSHFQVYWKRAKYQVSPNCRTYRLLNWLQLPLNVLSDRSWYMSEGSAALTSKALALCQSLGVTIRFETEVSGIDVSDSRVHISTDDQPILASRVLIPHGVADVHYSFDQHANRQSQSPITQSPRPQLLAVLSSAHVEPFAEFILLDDKLIKYVHEISGYAQPDESLVSSDEQILAIALHPNVMPCGDVAAAVFHHLKRLGIVDYGAKLIETRLAIEFIPKVDYGLAKRIEDASGGRISFLATENMAAAIGENAARWTQSLGPLCPSGSVR